MKLLNHFFLSLSISIILGYSALVTAAPLVYGANVDLEQAKQLASAAADEAKRLNLNVAIAIVDTGGHLVYFEKSDGTQVASAEVAIAKARSANNYRRATKIFEDAVLSGRSSILGLPGAVPVEGGLPIMIEQRVVGAIGISGASSSEDGMVAAAAAQVFK